MAEQKKLKVAIVGCGNISKGYASTMGVQSGKVHLVGALDLVRERAETLSKEFGGRVYDSLEQLLADRNVDAIINLTTHNAHAELTAQCLRAGKHVHSEKPLALDPAKARELSEIAKRHNVRLSTAPSTFLGESSQTAWKVIREGRLGKIRVAYAEMNHGRIESWHPQPRPFYNVGPTFDVGVYPLTLLTTMLGPVAEVFGVARTLWPTRTDQAGNSFDVQAPDWSLGILQFESGVLGRLTTNFYVGPTKQQGVEIHGDVASLYISSASDSNASVQIRPFTEWEWTDVPLVGQPYQGIEWARGVSELADAVRENRPHRATGEQAAHVVEIIAGILESSRSGQRVKISSRFQPPEPMEWAR